jgi:hypothetical protein
MRDRGPIFVGLFLFVALFTFPVWRGAIARTVARQPELTLPAGQKDCVLPAEQMRKTHMQLLIQWREEKVRDGITTYTAYDGKKYSVSLTGTCLKCHGDQPGEAQLNSASLSRSPKFCDTCHQYSGVSTPYCFDCHVNLKPTANTMQASGTSVAQPEAKQSPVAGSPPIHPVLAKGGDMPLAARSAR